MEDNKKVDEFSLADGFKIDDGGYSNFQKNQKDIKNKSNGTLKAIIWIFSIIIVSVIIAGGAVYVGADYLGIGFGRGGNCVLDIKEGSATVTIAQKLEETGAVKCPLVFRLYSKLKHYDGKYKYGVYNFNSEIGYEGIANMLMNDGAKAETVSVTIIEGSNVDDIAKLLEEKGVCKKGDFIDAVQDGKFEYDFVKQIPSQSVYYRFEGYLFPETYSFYCYDSEECAYLAVDKMLSTLNERIKKANLDVNNIKIDDKSYTFHEVMSMASIVEMEAGNNPEEMSKVAAVFFNRLKSPDFATLGSSPTRKYPYGNGKYNTYECNGLPVGPLCSPGIASIKATYNPAENFDNYYFVTDASMNFYYNKTLSQHNSIIAKLKAEKNWIYEE